MSGRKNSTTLSREQQMREHLDACGEIKVFAMEKGVSLAYAHHIARDIGYHSLKVSAEERALILNRRKGISS